MHACMCACVCACKGVFGMFDKSYTGKLDSLVKSPALDSSLLTSDQTQVSLSVCLELGFGNVSR